MCLQRQDKEETAQWLSSPKTIKCMIEACLSRISSLKGQTLLVHRFTQYDGNFEKAWPQVQKKLLFQSSMLRLFTPYPERLLWK